MRTTAGRRAACWPVCSAEMAFSVSGQALLLGGALALGAAVGVLYDAFRVLRVRLPLPLLGGILDLLFWLAVTAGLLDRKSVV